MTIKKLLSELNKLYPFCHDKFSNDIISICVAQYIKLINDVDNNEFITLGVEKDSIIEKIEDVKNVLSKSYNDYLNGNHCEAIEGIYNKFFAKSNNRVLLRGVTEKVNGYRIRESKSYHLYKNDEMFHIPFELRGLVENQRFSLSGYPCLYLGSSLYVCWEELDRPSIDSCNMIGVSSQDNMTFIDLLLPNKIAPSNCVDTFCRIPIILACGIKVNNQKDTFKPEYIIPQVLLQCIIKINSEGGVKYRNATEKIKIDGIKYFSTHYGDPQIIFKERYLHYNYVLPIQSNNDTGLCSYLTQKIFVSQTHSSNIEKIKSFSNLSQIDAIETTLSEEINNYQTSLFGIMEARLNADSKVMLSNNLKNSKRTFKFTKNQLEKIIENQIKEKYLNKLKTE